MSLADGVDLVWRHRQRTEAPEFDLRSADRKNNWSPRSWQGKTDTGDGTVPYLGARPTFVPVNQIICVADHDFGYWELKDRLLEGVAAGLHASLPLMNLCQRLVVSHFLGRQFGKVWGRKAPDIRDQPWDPPIDNLKDKTNRK